MWVATEAEFDQRAVRMHAEGAGLPAEAILKRYLPQVGGVWNLQLKSDSQQQCWVFTNTIMPLFYVY